MALQSQTIRGNSVPRSYGGGSSRDIQKRFVGIVLLVALIAATAYWYFDHTPEPARSSTSRLAGPTPALPSADVPSKSATHSPISPTGSRLADPAPSPTPTPASQVAPAPSPSRSPDIIAMGGPTPQRPATSTSQSPESAPPTQPTPTQPTPTQPTPTQPAPTQPPPANPQPSTPAPSISTPAPQPATSPQPVRDPLLATPTSPRTESPNAPIPTDLAPDLIELVRQADRFSADNKLVEARAAYSRVLTDPRTSPAAAAALRPRAAEVNNTLIFSPAVAPADPLVATYKVAKGDSLVRIARAQQTVTEPGLIARVNRLANPDALRLGQSLKLVRGPFHAVVSKSTFRLDLYAGPAPSGTPRADGPEPNWLYIRSFAVGLGEKNSTPVAAFSVKERSKLVNPFWVNPRTGEKFDADDAKNPIGERWIGLEGLTLRDQAFTGYGIHGTIDPDSIGREMSMGCVRLNAPDIETLYDFLMPKVSIVKVVE